MALAETAKLLASLELKDQFTPTVNKALAGTTKLETRFGKLGGTVSKGFQALGQNLKNLVTGPVGILGLGAGLLGLTKFIQDSVGKAREFGETVFRVKAIIGGTTEDVSKLVDVLGDYGVESDAIVRIGGLFEKNLGNIAKSAKAAAQFQEDYGIALLDATGRARSFNDILIDAADLFASKTIPQSTKAAALAKLYGRNWQELVPILSKGGAALERTLDRGITLTDDQAKALERARKAGIRWEDAIGDLQTMIGIELLPVITKFVNRVTRFVNEHGPEIRAFFRDAAKFAQGMGRAIKNDVLPAIQQIGDIWAGMPDDLKKVLIGGFAVNKLTGGALTGIVAELGKGLIKGVLGINAGVVNIKAATVVGGGGTPITGPTGGSGIVGNILRVTVVGIAAAALSGLALELSGILDPKHRTESGDIFRGTNDNLEKILQTEKNIAALQERANNGDAYAQRQLEAQKALLAQLRGQQASSAAADRATQQRQLTAIHASTNSTARNLDQVEGAVRGVTNAVNRKKLSVDFRVRQSQRQAIQAAISGTATRQGKSGFQYTSDKSQTIDYRRVLAKGAVGIASTATPAIFGEAGKEAYAILRQPRKGFIGGAAPVNVKVTVNIDPRRVTKKQTSSGIYKTYVAT